MASVVFGLPMYNSEAYVGAVIESLLALDYEDFAIVAVDDCSSDSTVEIASAYAENDPRLVVERNPQRLGMIANWNTTLRRAYERHPDFAYFAFASDNDLRRPTWLSSLVQALEEEPEAVLSYSRFGTTDETEHEKARWLFDTRGIRDPLERQRITTASVRAGPVMYGLHRRSALERAGEVPEVLLSDVLFLSHLSLYGTFVQTPDVLWFRGDRRTGWSGSRQRRALFAAAPRSAYLPVSLQHTLWLFRHMVIGSLRPDELSRLSAFHVTLRYPVEWWKRHLQRGLTKQTKRRKKQRKRWAKRRKTYRRLATRLLRLRFARRVLSRLLGRPR